MRNVIQETAWVKGYMDKYLGKVNITCPVCVSGVILAETQCCTECDRVFKKQGEHMVVLSERDCISIMDHFSDIIWKHVESHWFVMWYDCAYCESLNTIADAFREYTGLEDM